MADRTSLYETDFVRWAEEQAAAIRAASASGTNLPLDWENIAEEIETLGKSDRRELRSRLRTLIEHLLKLECSPAPQPRAGWMTTVVNTRAAINDILDDSPSLKVELLGEIARAQNEAARTAALELEIRGETADGVNARLHEGGYRPEQLLEDWWPGGQEA